MQATVATCTSCIKGDIRHLGAQKRTPDTQSSTTSGREARREHETEVDSEAGMLSGISRKRSIRSNPCWFTEFCKSQCLSHFAAPFIVVRAETSVAESCKEAITERRFPPTGITSTTRVVKEARVARQQGLPPSGTHTTARAANNRWALPKIHTVREFTIESSQRLSIVKMLCVNDPSAGSPTETLLRLLLPLSDKVH